MFIFSSMFPCGKERAVGGFRSSPVLSTLQTLPTLLCVSVMGFPKSSHLNVLKLVSPKMHENLKLFMKI